MEMAPSPFLGAHKILTRSFFRATFWSATCCKILIPVQTLATKNDEFSENRRVYQHAIVFSCNVLHANEAMSTNKMAAVLEVQEAILEDVTEAPESMVEESSRLSDEEKRLLIAAMKDKKCLWGSEKANKMEKKTALDDLVQVFAFKFTQADILAAWKSLRASTMREVKRKKNDATHQPTWKFYQPLLYLKPNLDKACEKAEDWQDDEKRTIISFYSQHNELWNHKLRDYHDKSRRLVLLTQLKDLLKSKYSG